MVKTNVELFNTDRELAATILYASITTPITSSAGRE